MKKSDEIMFFNTEEFAKTVSVKPQTVRRGLCIDGHYLSIRPVKLPNRRLLWSVAEIKRILEGRL